MGIKIRPVHPGEYLRELMMDFNVSAAALARHIHLSPMRISHVLNGKRPVTADLALRLERAFGLTAGYWMNLQSQYDLAVAGTEEEDLKAIQPMAA